MTKKYIIPKELLEQYVFDWLYNAFYTYTTQFEDEDRAEKMALDETNEFIRLLEKEHSVKTIEITKESDWL